MIDEKSAPAPGSQPQLPPPSYASQSPSGQAQSPPHGAGYGPPQGYGPPTGAPPYSTQAGPYVHPQDLGYGPSPMHSPGQGHPQQAYYGPPHGVPPQGPMAGYPPQAAPRQLSVGAQYQEQLLAMCAQGNHDVQTRHGIAGIIGAIVFFPIGLLCLL
ncbi:hypothetical protein ACG7TL_006277 [Trametes sanguinea]